MTLRRGSLFLILGAILLIWLVFTPDGLLGKADALGYSVCHRITLRSFDLVGRQLPLCARCSGMYLGILLGLGYQLVQGRRCGWPVRKFLWLAIPIFIIFLTDAVNSYLQFFPGAPALYTPFNELRLLTGAGFGIMLGTVLAVTLNQTLWRSWDPRPALSSWRQIGLLAGLAGVIILAILSDNPLLLYPLAVLSAGAVWLVFSCIYTLGWLLFRRQENRYATWVELKWLALAGCTAALLQIALFDLLRFALTHTWVGAF